MDEGPKIKPEMVKYYNSTKGGVDTFDQIFHSLSTKRKYRRRPMVILYNILDTLGIASHIIYRELVQGNNLAKKRPEFKEDLTKYLLEHNSRRWAKLRKSNVLLELSIQHVSEVWKIQRPSQSEQTRNEKENESCSEQMPELSRNLTYISQLNNTRASTHSYITLYKVNAIQKERIIQVQRFSL